MLDQWLITSNPSPQHEKWANESQSLFASSSWGFITEALGATPIYAWNQQDEFGVMIPIFKPYGIRLGFLGFPVLGQPWQVLSAAKINGIASQLTKALKLHVMRFNKSMSRLPDQSMTAARPEVWIEDLQSWSTDRSKRLRKDLAFARRSRHGIELKMTCDNHLDCYQLYESTVRNHGGKVRYTQKYFERILAITKSQVNLNIFTATGEKGELHGFAILAIDGITAYYLHGATDEAGKRYGVSDLLLESLILRARSMGAEKLSLMASPWDQTGLIKFKQKWGGKRGLTITYDVTAGVIGSGASAIMKIPNLNNYHLSKEFIQG